MLRMTGLVLILTAPSVFAGDLSAECEKELALSALPDRLRSEATVYVRNGERYKVVQQGSNFSCIVERNHPLSIIPQCMDSKGRDSILPALIWKSERIMAGESPEQVTEKYKDKLAKGEFAAPAGAGVSYMTSAFNWIHIAARDQRIAVGPHVMFYAPDVENMQIGGSQQYSQSNRGMPFVLDPGPHGYMISFVEKTSEPDAVLAACDGQLEAFGLEL